MPWALEFIDLDRIGRLMGRFRRPDDTPSKLSGYTIAVFATRQQARNYAREQYGYIKDRPDLLGPPHNWRVPRVVKVEVTVEQIL